MMSKKIVRFVLAVGIGAAPVAAMAATAVAAKAPGYTLKGNYYESCACAVSCPCAANKTLPTEGHCDVVSLFHIATGTAGSTKLDGLNMAMVARSPKGQKVLDSFEKGEMDLMTLYLDDKATPAQREALNKVIPALFGTKEMKGSRPPQWVPMSLDVKGDVATFTISGGEKLAFEIENVSVGDTTKLDAKASPTSHRIELTNSAPFPWVHSLTQGFSKNFHYADLGTSWDYKDRNAFFGVIAASGALPAAKP
jgi:hypothetical protein